MTYLCPYTQICPIYQNWTEQTKDKRVDVIVSKEDQGDISYDCLALISIFDHPTEGGIPIGQELKIRLHGQEEIGCSHLTLLNSFNGLLKFVLE